MPEPDDMVMPMLVEMRAEIGGRFDNVDRCLAKIEAAKESFRHALTADTLMSRLLTGEFEERIEALERKVEELAGRR